MNFPIQFLHSHIPWLGYITFTIVLGSLSLVILASFLVKPWQPKVTAVFIGSILTLFGGFILFTFVWGLILGIFIP
ncbi:MAG: hypothetical protein HYU85_02485 [Chloroflexi bacterium]|nr:hypothetical protein [Chloroflexota bacterium]